MRTITTVTQELVSFALPRGQSGLVWSVAHLSAPSVAREVGEGDIPGNVTVVFIAGKPDTTRVSFEFTNGERPRRAAQRDTERVVKRRPKKQ